MAITEDSGGLDFIGISDRRGHIRLVKKRASHWAEVMNVKTTIRRRPWLAYSVFVLLGLILIKNYWQHRTPPVEVISGEAMTTTAHPGEPVQFKFVVNRNEICPNTIYGEWVDSDNDPTPIKLPVRSRVVPQIGKNLSAYLTLDAPVQLGRMCYRSHVIHHCPSGEALVVSPPICIQVVPP